ncbi:MAG: HNH endonuclease signature motif containing protein [Dermatophilaceae bacterium]
MVQAALAGLGVGGAKATLMVTMTLSDLQERVGAGIVLGTTEDGLMLAPETARRAACDARVIPVVLGSRGEVLELGRGERLFTPAQARAVLLRDRHCTFPRCEAPAFWCDVHHVRHWADGGLTDRSNAALLCGRHHTIVHRDRLTATVTPSGVCWDTTPGSYDAALEQQTSRSA